jgi:lysophospholipase L1-like esterase
LWTLPSLALYPNSIEVDFNTGLEISKQIIAAYDNRTSEKIYLVPAHYVLDVEHDFQSTNEQYDKFNSALTYEKCTDRIHPKASGYYKLAELLYGYIKYFGSLDV